ncbi:efflux RND transporter periplasmic adaptor subunit [Gordoniibacillus kamchatkensis]|nr:efflux RND transporter periplasmic adaptor subunit [Paenibacillus sp. VKM B-2647]
MRVGKKWIILIAALLIAGGGTYAVLHQKKSSKSAAAASQAVIKVTKGEISSTISGTAQFQAKDIQNIIAPVDGVIKTMNLTRNKAVKKGDVLVELSVPSYETNLKEAQVTLQQYESDLSDLENQLHSLRIAAPISGKLTLSAGVDVGSQVSKTTKVATISDPSLLTVKLYFPVQEALQLKQGDSVQLGLDGYMLTKTGTVDSVGRDVTADAAGNKLVGVDISVKNDGTMDAGMKVKGTFTIGGKEVNSSGQAALDYVNTATVLANVSGTVQALHFKTGQTVGKGDVLIDVSNDTLPNDIASKQAAIDSQKIKVEDAQAKLNQLTIVAPFDGVFSSDFASTKTNVLASYPVGASIQQSTNLGAVASLDTMQLPIAVDELDLTSVKVGQKATVKVDAIAGKTFEGEVTQVSNVGTTSNGVTTYDVIVSVKNTEQNDLKYGMTATAQIQIQDKKNILTLPIQALQSRNGKYYVSLQKADGTTEEQHEVKIGVRSATMAEIVSGLNEGDQVVIPTRRTTNSNANRNQFPGGVGGNRVVIPGGSGGGGFPGGGGGGFGGRGN